MRASRGALMGPWRLAFAAHCRSDNRPSGWFAREGFPKGEIGRLLALMYEMDYNDLRDLLRPLRGQRR